MGSSTPVAAAASPEFIAAFRRQADRDGTMTFADFMALALYHPEVGYYRRARQRVGYAPDTDFFTASTSGAIFGELITAASCALLGDDDPRDFTFVEIGAEPGAGVLAAVSHPFLSSRVVQVGEPLELCGRCVVFSNELFDAQPFHRFVFRRQAWHEIAVVLRADELAEIEIPLGKAVSLLPAAAPEGYVIDAPLAATALMATIAAEPWTGVLIAADYGKGWRELIEATPAGTARAYFRHTQSNDLLARPGEQDLTCHICWDWLVDVVERSGFGSPKVESQEAFFVRHAASFIARTIAAEAAQFSQRKLALLQLLHPSHLGQKFQLLHAVRR